VDNYRRIDAEFSGWIFEQIACSPFIVPAPYEKQAQRYFSARWRVAGFFSPRKATFLSMSETYGGRCFIYIIEISIKNFYLYHSIYWRTENLLRLLAHPNLFFKQKCIPSLVEFLTKQSSGYFNSCSSPFLHN
jgi:hypothetical protein